VPQARAPVVLDVLPPMTTANDLLSLAAAGAPLEEQRAALAAALEERGVSGETIRHLMGHVRDGVVLRTTEEERNSRLGGIGLLPDGEPWPCDHHDEPLVLVAAIDLGELPALDPLPHDGTLLLYWSFMIYSYEKLDWFVATRAYWVPPGAAMREQRKPPGEWPELGAAPLAGAVMPIAGEAVKVIAKVGDAPDREALLDAMNHFAPRLYRHQLLGSSRDIQGPVLDEISYWLGQHARPETAARFSETERDGEGWVLLAQIEEDVAIDNLGIGDGGAIYFVMPEADLCARRFDRVVGIMQCH
jgi:uncharacterized protein DUF1963